MLCCMEACGAAHTAHRACRRRAAANSPAMVYVCGMLTTHFQPLRPAAAALNLFRTLARTRAQRRRI